METKYKLVLLRHGQSTWNLENRFTGWTDVGLTEQGNGEAHTAGQLLRENKYTFDLAYTSVSETCHSNPLDRFTGNEPGVDSGCQCLAVE